jgi:hypothetical protein
MPSPARAPRLSIYSASSVVLWVILEFPGFRACLVCRGSENLVYPASLDFRAIPVNLGYLGYLANLAFPANRGFRASRAIPDFPVCRGSRAFRAYPGLWAIPVNLDYRAFRAIRACLGFLTLQGYRAPEPSQNLLRSMQTR